MSCINIFLIIANIIVFSLKYFLSLILYTNDDEKPHCRLNIPSLLGTFLSTIETILLWLPTRGKVIFSFHRLTPASLDYQQLPSFQKILGNCRNLREWRCYSSWNFVILQWMRGKDCRQNIDRSMKRLSILRRLISPRNCKKLEKIIKKINGILPLNGRRILCIWKG